MDFYFLATLTGKEPMALSVLYIPLSLLSKVDRGQHARRGRQPDRSALRSVGSLCPVLNVRSHPEKT
jgi:hypothetical protein